jgi:type I restriction enzyme R subunit
MVVASSVLAAARYEFEIKKAIDARLKEELEKPDPDKELIEQIEFLKIGTVVTQQDNNEEAYITQVRKMAQEIKAVENFKKDFDYSKDEDGNYIKPLTGVAFLCVCDRLLTGFDAPIAQVMYLDKNIREHDLLQAIARVNRTKGEKEHGIIVDYYGVSNHLREALEIWDEDEENLKELLNYFRDIDAEIPILEARYKRLLDLFHDHGVKNFEEFVSQKITDTVEEFAVAEKCIELAEKVAFRAQFDTYLKAFFDSLDLLFNSRIAKDYYVPAKRFGYLLMRIRNRYKDPTMDLKWAKAKVRKLIDKYLQTLQIDSKIPPVSLLSEDFPKEVNKFSFTPKSKASEMEHAIRKHIKVNFDKDPALYKSFLEKMEDIMKRYKDNWEELVSELERLREEMKKGRRKKEGGLTDQQAPFFDLIILQAFKKNFDIEDDTKDELKKVTIEIVDKLQDALVKPNFWKEREADIRKLTGEIDDILNFSDIKQLEKKKDQLKSDIMQLAKRRHQELTGEE